MRGISFQLIGFEKEASWIVKDRPLNDRHFWDGCSYDINLTELFLSSAN